MTNQFFYELLIVMLIAVPVTLVLGVLTNLVWGDSLFSDMGAFYFITAGSLNLMNAFSRIFE